MEYAMRTEFLWGNTLRRQRRQCKDSSYPDSKTTSLKDARRVEFALELAQWWGFVLGVLSSGLCC